MRGIGSHLSISCYDCPKEKLMDMNFIEKVFIELFSAMGINEAKNPHVFIYKKGNNSKKTGVSGTALSQGAHLIIHTFAEKNEAFIGFFSTGEFDSDYVVNYVTNAFEAKKSDFNVFS